MGSNSLYFYFSLHFETAKQIQVNASFFFPYTRIVTKKASTDK